MHTARAARFVRTDNRLAPRLGARYMIPAQAALATGRRAAIAAAAAVCCAVAALHSRSYPAAGSPHSRSPQLQQLPQQHQQPHRPAARPAPPRRPLADAAPPAAAGGAAPAGAAGGMQGVARLFGSGRAGGGQAGAARAGQDRLVDYLITSELVKTPRVEAALRAVDRKKFVDPAHAPPAESYQDTPLPIGYAQTISAPHMHAICLELLEGHLKPGARALDVGSGSGYLAAAMALMVAPDGRVLGVEKVPELAVRSVESIQAAAPGLLPPGARAGDAAARLGAPAGAAGGGAAVLEIVHGNALADWLEREPPFDAIHVGAAADELHALLVRALAPGGRMVIPVGPRYASQVLTVVDKAADGSVSSREMMHVGYVPLTRPSEMEDGWRRA
ncbi:hypothetical protein Rsub_11687 [Raphidocelis subcapitata]|uniref:protein-L-isoaspartate(D-aspartate) O-methyltransferase n=1 Tax=Raphidocelis subcapitata TaxID=307507 RepID=A0A2V0PMA0_9CHLO|nr:hypothetical protein Rsub_11687 [Raphidocelis subcapitata]|eukprot:GBF98477.1 hypothetical protein Rsub_11687 [Raphidocelis subcapitata]